MHTTIRDFFKKVETQPYFFHNVARFYRFLRLLCCLLEERYPETSWRAGFKVSIGWTEALGDWEEEGE